jgi:hypothetical protein
MLLTCLRRIIYHTTKAFGRPGSCVLIPALVEIERQYLYPDMWLSTYLSGSEKLTVDYGKMQAELADPSWERYHLSTTEAQLISRAE